MLEIRFLQLTLEPRERSNKLFATVCFSPRALDADNSAEANKDLLVSCPENLDLYCVR